MPSRHLALSINLKAVAETAGVESRDGNRKMDLVFSTSGVPRSERIAALSEVVSSQFVPLRIAPIAPDAERHLLGEVRARSFDDVKIALFSGSSVLAERTTRHIDESGHDDYLVALHTRGVARVRHAGRRATLGPGDLALLDSARPYAIELMSAGPFEHIAYQIPRAALEARTDGLGQALCLPLTVGSDAGGLASRHLRAIASPKWHTRAPAALPLIEAGLDLLCAALADVAGLRLAGTSEQTRMLGKIKRDALTRLGDPHLAPGTLAGAHYISTRQLHRLFASEGTTFGTWIREQRLRRCRAALADQRLSDTAIGEIARRWGYSSAAHFSRLFTARYGIAPRDFRREVRASRT